MSTARIGPGITRYDLETSGSHGYMVRICRKGKKTSEFFADKKYGGKRNAKKMAQQRYTELCETLGTSAAGPTKNLMTTRNTTGAVGVHIARSTDDRWGNGEYFAYCASWIAADAKRQKISFSWNKYGKLAAYELACLARKKESTDRTEILKIYKRRVARRR
ncbi:MAG: transcriptional regulator [Pirellulaceae bacterium]|nr:transcriptional regulator [Pirellulaceae bacterium]